MAIARKAGVLRTFQLKGDRKEDGTLDPNNTTWQLATLKADEMAEVENCTAKFSLGSTDAQFTPGARVLTSCRMGIRGVSGFSHEDGTKVAFEHSKGSLHASDNFLDQIAPNDLSELATAITELQTVPEIAGD